MGTITSCVIDELSQCVNSSQQSYGGHEFQMYVDRSGIPREFNPTLKSNGNEELQYIAQRDSYIMIPGDEWYLINVDWLALWLEYAKNATTEQPGKISNTDLIDESNPKKMKLNMIVKRDFRCVCKEVWNYLYERHGGGPILYFIGYSEKSYKTGEWIKKTNMEEFVTIIYPYTFNKSKAVVIDSTIEAVEHNITSIANNCTSDVTANTTNNNSLPITDDSSLNLCNISHIAHIIKIQKTFRKYLHNKKLKYNINIRQNSNQLLSHASVIEYLSTEQKQKQNLSSFKVTSIIKLKCALNKKKIILQKLSQTFEFKIKQIDNIQINNILNTKHSFSNNNKTNNDSNNRHIFMIVSGAILNANRNSPMQKGIYKYVSQYKTKERSIDMFITNNSNSNSNKNNLLWDESGFVCAINGYSDILITIWITGNTANNLLHGTSALNLNSNNTNSPTSSPNKNNNSNTSNSSSHSLTSNPLPSTNMKQKDDNKDTNSMIGQVRIPVAHYYSTLYYQQSKVLTLPIEFIDTIKTENQNSPERKYNNNNNDKVTNIANNANLSIELKLPKFECTLSGWVWMRSSSQTTSLWHKVWAVYHENELLWFDSPMTLHMPLGVITNTQINKIDECEQGGILCLFLGVTLKSDVDDTFLLMHWMERGSTSITGSPSDTSREMKEKKQNGFIDMNDRFNNRITWLRRLRKSCRK